MNFLKHLFKTPSAEELAKQELENAKRDLLQALTQKEYWEQIVVYQTKRVSRLGAAK
jgi:hypothetical protein